MAEKSTLESVELGFLEETDSAFLRSHYFPSKLGGKPAWLSLTNLPNIDDLSCRKCGKTSVFMMQVYSPNQNVSLAFHRTIFIFICRDPVCSENNSDINFLVFRSQLPRKNDFYSEQPPKESTVTPGPSPKTELCTVCGVAGPKKCSKCHTASYCSKDHQVVDWKNGHKEICSGEKTQKSVTGVLFPEFELTTEPEELNEGDSEKGDEDTDKEEQDRWKEYEEFLKSSKAGTLMSEDGATPELEKMAFSENMEDQTFSQFKQRIRHEPNQVLRYLRGGEPLWVSSHNKPSKDDVPNCSCGAPRKFEFQVMPQILSHMGVDSLGKSIDFGTLCVYTCSQDCDIGNDYHKEFLWKQDYTQSTGE